MKFIVCVLSILMTGAVYSQELFVYSEPASNIPARSVNVKVSANYITPQQPFNRFMQRYNAEGQVGISKKLMMKSGVTFADLYTSRFRWESVYLYARYRFLSNDDLHRHFRMALFAEGAYTRSPFKLEEVSLNGDRSGVQLGLIATQLLNKLALSATVSHTQVLNGERGESNHSSGIYQVMNYSLSAGYLLLPFEYADYHQTNMNLYVELLAQQALDHRGYFIDLAPAVQFIFNSNTKLNLGYRFQLGGDLARMSRNGFLVSVERSFLNVLK